MVTSKLAVGEIDAVNVLTDRVERRFRECREASSYISVGDTHAYTREWKETDGQVFHLRNAKCFVRVMKESPIIIRDGELIVGSQSKYLRGAEPTLYTWPYDALHALETGVFHTTSEVVPAKIEEEEKKILKEDALYWAGRSLVEQQIAMLREESGDGDDLLELGEHAVLVVELVGAPLPLGPGGLCHIPPSVVHEGLNTVIARAKAEDDTIAKTCGLHERSAAGYHKHIILKGIVMSSEAVIEYANKHATVARSLAETESDPVRKRELEEIAERCEWVPANPPRSFTEALQSYWFIHLAAWKESGCAWYLAPGRLDQYLYPYYEKDLREGRITRQEAAELLGCFWVKLNELDSYRSDKSTQIGAASLFPHITIGGRSKGGSDVTNELSYLILEVLRQMKTPSPAVYIRCHDGMDHEFLMKATEVLSEYGGGSPAFLSEESVLKHLCGHGIPLDDAIEWIADSCLTYNLPQAGARGEISTSINMPKVLEITLHNGVDPRTGKHVGCETGDVTKFTRIEQLYQAWEKQLDYILDKTVRASYFNHMIRILKRSNPFSSGFIGDCITKGLDVLEGGERYPWLSAHWGDRGCTDLADSFAAINKLVFDEKKLTMAQLLDALKCNFEGKEDLRQACLKAPKYGNDDDYADGIFNYVSLRTQELMLSKPDPWTGEKIRMYRPAATGHYSLGSVVGALPNGRKAYLPLNDAALSAMGGADVKGPTALINSATKVDHAFEESAIVFNVRFSKALYQTQEKREKLIALIKTFMDRGGRHIQFNILNRDDLIDAQRNPDKWRSLVVRVAGYSAYFVELPPKVQDEIIARTEHAL